VYVETAGPQPPGPPVPSMSTVDSFYRRLARLPRTSEPPPPWRELASEVSCLVLRSGDPIAVARPRRLPPVGPAGAAGLTGTALGAGPNGHGGPVDGPGPLAGRLDLADREVLMEHLGHLAADAPRTADAEAFAAALVPLAAQLLPAAPAPLLVALPRLIRSTTAMIRGLRGDRSIRPLVRTVPAIVRAALAADAEPAGAGEPPSPRDAVEALAYQACRVLSDPTICVEIYARSRQADRRFHAAERSLR